jgi:hypothetical protein
MQRRSFIAGVTAFLAAPWDRLAKATQMPAEIGQIPMSCMDGPAYLVPTYPLGPSRMCRPSAPFHSVLARTAESLHKQGLLSDMQMEEVRDSIRGVSFRYADGRPVLPWPEAHSCIDWEAIKNCKF